MYMTTRLRAVVATMGVAAGAIFSATATGLTGEVFGTWAARLIGFVTVALTLYMVFRSLRLGVTVESGRLHVRNLWRDRIIDRREVVAVEERGLIYKRLMLKGQSNVRVTATLVILRPLDPKSREVRTLIDRWFSGQAL